MRKLFKYLIVYPIVGFFALVILVAIFADEEAVAVSKAKREAAAEVRAAEEAALVRDKAREAAKAAVGTNRRSMLMSKCHDEIRAGAKYPSSVDFHIILGSSTNEIDQGDGNFRMTYFIDFDAKNGLGNELPYRGKCIIDYSTSKNAYSIKELRVFNR